MAFSGAIVAGFTVLAGMSVAAVAIGGALVFRTDITSDEEPAVTAPDDWLVSVAAGGAALQANGVSAEAGSRNGPALVAEFDRPVDMAFDPQGNLIIADSGNHQIRRLTPSGNVETVAGSGVAGIKDGPAAEAQFRTPVGIAVSPDGTIFVSDAEAATIRAISPDGSVRTVAGVDYLTCNNDPKTEDGALPPRLHPCPAHFSPWYRDGNAAEALIGSPAGIAFDSEANRLFVADSVNHCIRAIDLDAKTVSTFAGACEPGYEDGPASKAKFTGPVHLGFDAAHNLLVSENGNRIRAIDESGFTTTVAGDGNEGSDGGDASQASFTYPTGFAIYGSRLIVADSGNQLIRAVQGPQVSRVAGTGGQGFRTGSGAQSTFSYPIGVAVDAHGTIFVSDYNLGRIFKIVAR